MKMKTWGPSTCHQKERGQIIKDTVPAATTKSRSKSAPNLEKNQQQAISCVNFVTLRELGTDDDDDLTIRKSNCFFQKFLSLMGHGTL